MDLGSNQQEALLSKVLVADNYIQLNILEVKIHDFPTLCGKFRVLFFSFLPKFDLELGNNFCILDKFSTEEVIRPLLCGFYEC